MRLPSWAGSVVEDSGNRPSEVVGSVVWGSWVVDSEGKRGGWWGFSLETLLWV